MRSANALTAMPLMAGEGAFGTLPNCVIYAGNHWETKAEGTGSETSARTTVTCEVGGDAFD